MAASRVLSPAGRVIMVKPAVTPLSGFFYRFLHEEPTDMTADPWEDGVPNASKDPYVGNQALPTLLFRRHLAPFRQAFPELHVVSIDWLALFAYPLSGGFKSWRLITPGLARVLLKLEDLIAPAVGRVIAFRMMVVLEKGGRGPANRI